MAACINMSQSLKWNAFCVTLYKVQKQAVKDMHHHFIDFSLTILTYVIYSQNFKE